MTPVNTFNLHISVHSIYLSICDVDVAFVFQSQFTGKDFKASEASDGGTRVCVVRDAPCTR